jgi:hypothetical protein
MIEGELTSMTCKHRPKFTFKILFARKPDLVCRNCGVELEMTSKTQTTSRVLNSVLIAALFFKVLSGSSGSQAAPLQKMLTDIGVMLLYILIYLVAYYLLIQFGQFTEKIKPIELAIPEVAANAASSISPAAGPAEADQAKSPTDAAGGEKPQYTQEQLDLMELYKSYAKDEADQATADAQSGASNQAQISTGLHQHIQADECDHEPVKNWKTYIPTNFNYVCAKCGQPITFSTKTKKSLNLALMAVILAILMPTFTNTNVNAWEYGLLTLLAFAVAALIQFFYLRKSTYEIRAVEPGKKR